MKSEKRNPAEGDSSLLASSQGSMTNLVSKTSCSSTTVLIRAQTWFLKLQDYNLQPCPKRMRRGSPSGPGLLLALLPCITPAVSWTESLWLHKKALFTKSSLPLPFHTYRQSQSSFMLPVLKCYTMPVVSLYYIHISYVYFLLSYP